ncbi:class I SAM-dependent DNA methyltransferase, partial [Streptomyces fungicidicus]
GTASTTRPAPTAQPDPSCTTQRTITPSETASKNTRGGSRKEQIRGERRPVIPLASLDDWLDFAESLLGTQDVAADSLVAQFDTLDELERYEDELPEWMGMERFTSLESRYPWAGVAKDVAEQQGFFHWELEFGQVFARGGYDLQVGNPPWVRPDWQEDAVLAELDPWFMLSEKPSAEEWRLHKEEILTGNHETAFYLTELTKVTGTSTLLSSVPMYPLLNKTRPDLYRAFMAQVWQQTNAAGTAGLIHPDTHFAGVKEKSLRGAAYRHLRAHAHFYNRASIFPDIHANTEFSINIYGAESRVSFTHVSWLFSPETLTESLGHDGRGPLPGIKHKGKWELRPHLNRLISVNAAHLTEWNRLSGDNAVPDAQAPLLYPVTSQEQGAISVLSGFQERIGFYTPQVSQGYNETTSKRDGIIRWSTTEVNDLTDLIIQGPHFAGATPFNKQPNNPCKTNRDWSPFDLTTLSTNVAPRTNYIRFCDQKRYLDNQDVWDGRRYTEYFRLAWRLMIPFDTERSLFAALIPPGPAHTHGVLSMALPNNQLTVLNAGFWAALPLDYLLRIAGRANLTPADANKMPAASPEHPLAPPLLLRSLRLNALTAAYAPLWEELFHPAWPGYEGWANPNWPNLKPLAGELQPAWEYKTPLRTEYERRAALVELDALVSVWLGITADQLVAVYKSRYPVLSDYESEMYFDAMGRKIAANHNTYGHGQTKQDYIDLMAHLENPKTTPPPAGYTAPFYKADREAEMRAAHTHFQTRLDKEIAACRWTPPESREA